MRVYRCGVSYNRQLPKMQANHDADYVINNGQRYVLQISSYHRHNDHIVYQANIYDAAYNLHHTLYFRFKALREFHLQLAKEVGQGMLPEFPKTKSFGFWNRTNDSLNLIKERMRELQYYLSKLVNNGRLLRYQRVRRLHSTIRLNTERRTSSYPLFNGSKRDCFERECPDFYRRALHTVFGQ